ncbi:Type II secretion system protein D precursor [compost metagenome]|uniref:General secretion pathway protein D n=2 Tax=Serratia TaxID=613 RepID=S4YQC0_SERPL|nr:general secretion pathway protein D [Serratia plymuthica S13]EKF66009.1 general secretion pathway protein D [Serratia plymuthica A30]KYG14691.1 Type II secretion system protein D precursor [Serratia plymuthica]CAI0863253.1 Pullulanase secretion envelope pulD [Serratia plymuthica]
MITHLFYHFGHQLARLPWRELVVVSMLAVTPGITHAASFSANFKGTDIQEFINTVSKNLGKTIIIDPAVKGKVTVRSYEQLNDKQYYQFFLNVLDVYGYTVIGMPNNVLKVIVAKDGKRAALSQAGGELIGEGDEVVMRIVPLRNIAAKDISPLLRQLNDSVGVGSVAHYEQGNALLITGRAAVVNGLIDIVREMDQDDSNQIETLALKHAAAAEIVRMVNALFREEGKQRMAGAATLRLVADERTNTVMITGDDRIREYVKDMIYQLDNKSVNQGNTQVIQLKYAKAQSLVEVLTGISSGLQNEKEGAATNVALLKNVVIKADEQTNALIITAAPDVMRDLEEVVAKLDVRRAQVLVEAVIVEVQDGQGLNIGVQWANKYGGGTQFGGNVPGVSTGFDGGMLEAFNKASGLMTGFYSGNWGVLLSAIASNNQNNILATPSIVTLDNAEAEFSVGQDVPILTGSQTTNSDNVFNTVSRKTVGIKLKVKPQINKGQSVLMQIEQEVSSVADNTQVSADSLGATFNIRTVNNTVLVDSGETVVVGGLLDKTNSEVESSVPLLGKIPVLGALFRSTSVKESKRNLMLFIRPTIIRTTEGFSQQSQRKVGKFDVEQREDIELKTALREEISSGQTAGDNQAFLRVISQVNAFYGQEGKP